MTLKDLVEKKEFKYEVLNVFTPFGIILVNNPVEFSKIRLLVHKEKLEDVYIEVKGIKYLVTQDLHYLNREGERTIIEFGKETNWFPGLTKSIYIHQLNN